MSSIGAFSVSLAVKDIAASRKFYETIGFDVFGGDQAQKWLIMKNDDCVIGLFEGMFENNVFTFNPGWSRNAENLKNFKDIRDIKAQWQNKGLNIAERIDTKDGPASFTVTDPDGNTILIDQHV